MADTETWAPVVGFAGYDVSDHGRVRSWRSRNGLGCPPNTPAILTPVLARGYEQYCLKLSGKRAYRKAHRLVLEAFVGPCPDGMECRHFPDRNRTNNRLDNISWSTIASILTGKTWSHVPRCHTVTRAAPRRLGQAAPLRRSNINGRTGTTWHRGTGKWQAQIQVAGKSHYLGLHATQELAHAAYREAAAVLRRGELVGTPVEP